MRLVCHTKLQYRAGTSDKIYEVDLCETGGGYVVNFRYGRRGTDLREGTKTTDPVPLEKARTIFDKLVAEKTRKGYHVTGGTESESAGEGRRPADGPGAVDESERTAALLRKLRAPRAKSDPQISRVIWRAGELRIGEAVPHLISLIGSADALRDYCIAWSLGLCGDETTIPALEPLLGHEAEHVRRIAREAVRRLGGPEKRSELVREAVGKLPRTLRGPAADGPSEAFEDALREEMQQQQKGAYDVLTRLYEIDNEHVRPVLLRVIGEIRCRPRHFRPLRHIYKIAEYRRDPRVFGLVARKFDEERAFYHSNPWWDHVGVRDERGYWEYVKRNTELSREDSRLAYGNRTREYLRRRSWRTLRRLGEIGDPDYVRLARGALLAYTDADEHEPKRSVFYDYHHTGSRDWRNPRVTEILWDGFAPYLLFNHILYENSPRYELRQGNRAFRLREGVEPGAEPPPVREEAFPELWERHPEELVRLLVESLCRPVHEFAVKALRAVPTHLEKLSAEEISMLLSAPYEVTVELGYELAGKIYDPDRPHIGLATAVALCGIPDARQKAFGWIERKREVFTRELPVMAALLTSVHADTRGFAAGLLQTAEYEEATARELFEVLISALLDLGEGSNEVAADLGLALERNFAKRTAVLDPGVIREMLEHELPEVRALGGRILLNHSTPATELPGELLEALVGSEHEENRRIGIAMFGRLPDERLLERDQVLLALLSHELEDLFHSTRPIVVRLASGHRRFAEKMTILILISLLSKERHEGVRRRLLGLLEEIPGWTGAADPDTVRLLVSSEFPEAGEAAGRALLERLDEWTGEMTPEEIVGLTNHEAVSVRKASWRLAEANVESLRREAALLTRALDAVWADSREYWRGFFKEHLTNAELTPEVLVSVCDSVRPETRKFGRDLLLVYFEDEKGADYLLKLAEHPAPDMRLFATNYLEDHAAGSPETIERLAPFFTGVLSLVNRSRVTKDRVLRFLEREALRDERAARTAARILARQSATVAVGDREAMIGAMLRIRRRFPAIELPVRVIPKEVRGHAV